MSLVPSNCALLQVFQQLQDHRTLFFRRFRLRFVWQLSIQQMWTPQVSGASPTCLNFKKSPSQKHILFSWLAFLFVELTGIQSQPKVSQESQAKYQVKWLPRWLPPPPNLLLPPHPLHPHPQGFPGGFAARSARAFA